MTKHRTRHGAEFKAKVALTAFSEAKTLAKLSSEYEVPQTQITRWKQELIACAPDLFGRGKKKEGNREAEMAELHRQIGKCKVENDFLSNLPGLDLTGRKNRR